MLLNNVGLKSDKIHFNYLIIWIIHDIRSGSISRLHKDDFPPKVRKYANMTNTVKLCAILPHWPKLLFHVLLIDSIVPIWKDKLGLIKDVIQ